MEEEVIAFTEKEQYWINNLLKGEDSLDEVKSKSEAWVTNGYLDYLDLMIKCGNLRIPDKEYEKVTRLIKVNRVIHKNILNSGNYHYIVFNGLYVVQQVVFARAEHCEALLNKKLNDNENLSEEDLLISSFKTMTFENGEKWCIFLVKSRFTKENIGYTQSYWDYPYIYDEE